MTDQLDDTLKSFGITSLFSRQLFQDKAAVIQLQKISDIFVEGKQNSKEYLLLSGLAHRYNFSEKGNMVTTGFYVAQAVITPHFARSNKGKSFFSLQTLTDVVLAEIPVAELDKLRINNTEFNDFGQRVIENELSKSVLRDVTFRSFSAKERLSAMRKQYPNLGNLIPHNIIASYLGITNVSFSRLRKELTRE